MNYIYCRPTWTQHFWSCGVIGFMKIFSVNQCYVLWWQYGLVVCRARMPRSQTILPSCLVFPTMILYTNFCLCPQYENITFYVTSRTVQQWPTTEFAERHMDGWWVWQLCQGKRSGDSGTCVAVDSPRSRRPPPPPPPPRPPPPRATYLISPATHLKSLTVIHH